MPYKKTDMRKIFSYSTAANAAIIGTYLRDIAAKTGQPEGTIIEDLLFSAILPDHGTAAFYVRELLQYSDEPEALGRAFHRFMAFGAAGGSDWSARFANGRQMVELLREIMFIYTSPINGQEPQWRHLAEQWGSIVELLDYQPAKTDNEKYAHELNVRFANELYRQIKTDTSRESALVTDCVVFILRHWDVLGNHSRTYRALVDLVDLAQIRNTTNGRIAYIKTLSLISAEWPPEGSMLD